MAVAWQSEVDPYACRVLARHWPDVPNLGDIKTVDWSSVEPVDLICAGYPCQPFSVAGRRAGPDDPRHLWPYVASTLSAYYDPDGCCLRTCQGTLDLDLPTCSPTLPVSGSMRNGSCYQRQPLVPRTSDTGSSSWPTPTAQIFESEPEVFLARREREKAKGRNGNGFGLTLGMAVRLWPTPTARDWKDGAYCPNVPVNGLLGRAVWATPTAAARGYRPTAREGRPGTLAQPGTFERAKRPTSAATGTTGLLNPTWVEWLMGFPDGWTDLEPQETPSSHKSPNTSAYF